jgi:UDP-N-acetylglucosamine--N-acetylmuramyl-(pentapeptide) pyrophosphoryl-undecaprenol N-acetylglucosamine transferase
MGCETQGRPGDEEYDDIASKPASFPPGLSVLWVGSMGGMEVDLVTRAGLPFDAIPAAGVHGVGWKALPGNLMQLVGGYRKAKKILRGYHPDTLFFTGGYVAVPMAMAGRKIPSVLFVPDIEPGLALKTLARFSRRIAVSTEETRAYFPHHRDLVVTGYPTRTDLKTWNKNVAREKLGLIPDIPTLLVFGGSKGARSLNRTVMAVLPDLLAEMQVVHVSGHLDWQEVETAHNTITNTLTADLVSRYRIFPYLHGEMGAALSAADLVLSRAGASTLGEFPLFGLPAILVPYPYAWRYQQVNAQYLAQRGAALIINDADLPDRFLVVARDLMRDSDRRAKMSQAMSYLARPEAAKSIAHLLQNLAMEQGQERM